MEEEEWRPVVGWEKYYEVSSHGRIRSVERTDRRGKHVLPIIRKQGDHLRGYKLIGLIGDGRRTTKMVHSVVLTAFVGPRPSGMVCCHNDGDPTNNRLDNLRWDTQSSNLFDAVRHGTHSESRKTHCSRGHEYSPENTMYYTARKFRACRECLALYKAKRATNGRESA